MLVDNKINKLHINKPVDSHLSSTNHIVIAKGDSGASANYWRSEDTKVLQNMHRNTSINVTLPNNHSISSTQSGTIPLSNKLSTKSKEATVLPNLQSSSLISLGQLCDDDCKVLLDKKELNVYKDNQVLLRGYRNPTDGLWDIPIIKSIIPENYIMPKTHSAMYALRTKTIAPTPIKNKRRDNVN